MVIGTRTSRERQLSAKYVKDTNIPELDLFDRIYRMEETTMPNRNKDRLKVTRIAGDPDGLIGINVEP